MAEVAYFTKEGLEKLKQEDTVPLSELIPATIALFGFQDGTFIPIIPYEFDEEEKMSKADRALEEAIATMTTGWEYFITADGHPGFRGEFDHGRAQVEVAEIVFDGKNLWVATTSHPEPTNMNETLKPGQLVDIINFVSFAIQDTQSREYKLSRNYLKEEGWERRKTGQDKIS